MPVWAIVVTIVCTVGGLMLTLIITYTKFVNWLGTRIDRLEIGLEQHARQIGDHALAMRTTEANFISMVQKLEIRHGELTGIVQRIIGRLEVTERRSWDPQQDPERREHPRT